MFRLKNFFLAALVLTLTFCTVVPAYAAGTTVKLPNYLDRQQLLYKYNTYYSKSVPTISASSSTQYMLFYNSTYTNDWIGYKYLNDSGTAVNIPTVSTPAYFLLVYSSINPFTTSSPDKPNIYVRPPGGSGAGYTITLGGSVQFFYQLLYSTDGTKWYPVISSGYPWFWQTCSWMDLTQTERNDRNGSAVTAVFGSSSVFLSSSTTVYNQSSQVVTPTLNGFTVDINNYTGTTSTGGTGGTETPPEEDTDYGIFNPLVDAIKTIFSPLFTVFDLITSLIDFAVSIVTQLKDMLVDGINSITSLYNNILTVATWLPEPVKVVMQAFPYILILIIGSSVIKMLLSLG